MLENKYKYDYYCWFDGSCEPVNPGGQGGAGIIVKDSNGTLIFDKHYKLTAGPKMSNNVAEYSAVVSLLEYLHFHCKSGDKILVQGDSMMVVMQMKDEWQAKKGLYLNEYRRACGVHSKLKDLGVLIDFQWIPREENKEADKLSH